MTFRLTALALAGMLFTMAQPAAAKNWTLVIHGGAGTIDRDRITPEQDKAIRTALDAALAAGEKVLAGGGTALDAV